MVITQATVKDMEGVLALLKANHVSSMTEEEKKYGLKAARRAPQFSKR